MVYCGLHQIPKTGGVFVVPSHKHNAAANLLLLFFLNHTSSSPAAISLFFLLPFLSPSLCVLPQISEKQKSLYEALERQQHYQESLQSISTKMESIEGALNEGLEPNKSPESQMAAHQVREKEGTGVRRIRKLRLCACFTERERMEIEWQDV